MSTVSAPSLTLVERDALPSETPYAYLFNDAVSDAFGWNASGFAGSPAHKSDTLFLWESGCKIGDTWNCTTACLDPVQGPDMVWNSTDAMFTLQNCLLYPILASAAAQRLLVQDPPGLLEKYGIDINDNLSAESAPNGTAYFPVLESCVQDFCVEIAGRKEPSCSPWDYQNGTGGPDYAPWIPKSREDTLTGYVPFNLCGTDDYAGIPGAVNSDLAGPGVLISYMQQYVIVLAAYLFVVLNTTWIPAIISVFCYLTRRHDRSTGKATAQRINKRITSEKQTDILITALLDFHKSQLFFSMALQVACLYAVHNPAILAARTPKELQSGLLLLTIVGVSGVYPVVLNLLALGLGKKKVDLFTFILTFCAVILASANWLLSAPTVMKPAYLVQDGFDPVSCGGINPQQYCMRADRTVAQYLSEESAGASWQAAALVVPYLAIIYAGTEKYIKVLIGRLSGLTAKVVNSLLQTILFIMQIWLIFGVAALLLEGSIIISIKEISARDKWTLGQIIAVTVWIPCIVQWLYMVCCGIELGLGSRLAPNYKVVKKDKDDVESKPGTVDKVPIAQATDNGASGKTPTVQTVRNGGS